VRKIAFAQSRRLVWDARGAKGATRSAKQQSLVVKIVCFAVFEKALANTANGRARAAFKPYRQ
jgi:hypothetical protein